MAEPAYGRPGLLVPGQRYREAVLALLLVAVSLGLALGHDLAHALSHTARWTGAALLIATGRYTVIQAWRSDTAPQTPRPAPGRGPVGCWSPGLR